MNLLTATDDKLTRTRQDIDNEIRRRTLVHTERCDPAAIIYGNEMAKRALTIAVAGGHSILFVGPPYCGKTMIRGVALELGLSDSFEARPCPCGYRSHRNKPCDDVFPSGVFWTNMGAGASAKPNCSPNH